MGSVGLFKFKAIKIKAGDGEQERKLQTADSPRQKTRDLIRAPRNGATK